MMQKKAFLLGHPVQHSLSPLIHNHWIARHHIDARYEAVDVMLGDLRDAVWRLVDARSVRANRVRGVVIRHDEDDVRTVRALGLDGHGRRQSGDGHEKGCKQGLYRLVHQVSHDRTR